MGLEITYDGATGASDIVVLTPTPGGPADQAGIKAGDVLVAVDGTATKGLSLYDVSDLLQGEADSQVWLWVVAEGRACATLRFTSLTWFRVGPKFEAFLTGAHRLMGLKTRHQKSGGTAGIIMCYIGCFHH